MSEQQSTPVAPTSTPAIDDTTTQAHQTNGIPIPAPAPAPVVIQDSTVPAPASATAELGIDEEVAPPIVRMRSSIPAAAAMAANTNGQQASVNGHAAVQRGLELLAETEASQTNEEIKKLDTQLDYFNKYLDKFEKKNSELTERLSTLLQTQKEERSKRRASFMQREEELKSEQDSFEVQMRNMFAKCAQMRRASAPVLDNGVENTLEASRRMREGINQAPILEANGHEEAEAAATN